MIRCKDRDLAILGHKIPSHEYYELASSTKTISQGEELIALGYPDYGPGDLVNVRPGKVSSLPKKKGVDLIEVTQTLTPGMSGGPLLNAKDEVVGVIHKGGPDEGRNFAIAINVLDSLFKEYSEL